MPVRDWKRYVRYQPRVKGLRGKSSKVNSGIVETLDILSDKKVSGADKARRGRG